MEDFNCTDDRVGQLTEEPEEPRWGQEMVSSGIKIFILFKIYKPRVERVHDARLYRADFQVAAFVAILMEISRTLRLWIFGNNLVTYLPRKPLAYSAILTYMLLPALVAIVFKYITEFMWTEHFEESLYTSLLRIDSLLARYGK